MKKSELIFQEMARYSLLNDSFLDRLWQLGQIHEYKDDVFSIFKRSTQMKSDHLNYILDKVDALEPAALKKEVFEMLAGNNKFN